MQKFCHPKKQHLTIHTVEGLARGSRRFDSRLGEARRKTGRVQRGPRRPADAVRRVAREHLAVRLPPVGAQAPPERRQPRRELPRRCDRRPLMRGPAERFVALREGDELGARRLERVAQRPVQPDAAVVSKLRPEGRRVIVAAVRGVLDADGGARGVRGSHRRRCEVGQPVVLLHVRRPLRRHQPRVQRVEA